MFTFHFSSFVVTSSDENKTCLPINCILPNSFWGVVFVVLVSHLTSGNWACSCVAVA